jgi:hypothetical protein
LSPPASHWEGDRPLSGRFCNMFERGPRSLHS